MPDRSPARVLLLFVIHLMRLALAVAGVGAGALLPEMSRRLGFHPAQWGLLVMLFAVTFLVSVAVARRLVGRLGLGAMLLVSAIGFLAAMTTWALAQNFWWLAAEIAMFGLVAGFHEMGAAGLMVRASRGSVTGALAMLNATYCFGAFTTPVLAGWWLKQEGGWQVVPWASAACFLLSVVLLVWLAPRADRAWPPGETGSPGRAQKPDSPVQPRPPVVWWLAAVFVLYLATEQTLNNWSPTVLKQAFGLTPAQAAQVISGFWGLMWLGRMMVGPVARRLGEAWYLPLTAVLAAAAQLALALAGDKNTAVLVLAVCGFFLAPIIPLCMAMGAQAAPDRVEDTNGVLFISSALGLLSGPSMVGWVAARAGFGATLWISFGLCVLLAVAAWRVKQLYAKAPGGSARL